MVHIVDKRLCVLLICRRRIYLRFVKYNLMVESVIGS